MGIKVKVEQRHIDQGEPDSARGCPVALAIAEATGKRAVVTYETCLIGDTMYVTPREAGEKIYAYDQGKEIEPFELEMEERVPTLERGMPEVVD